MSTSITKTGSGGLVAKSFTPEQVELIRKQIAPKASADELALFLYVANKTGLDPLTRQIYCIHRRAKDENDRWVDKMTIQTSIDGFRVIAERSGDYGGQSEPEFFYDDKGNLVKAKVIVYKFRGDVRYEAGIGVAFWSEYVQVTKDGKPTSMWATKGHVMLSKVAEAIALRKAFPQDLANIYTDDEMGQADNPNNSLNEIEQQFRKGDIAVLRQEFQSLWEEYRDIVGENAAAPYHWEQWDPDGIKNPPVYVFAIDGMRQKLDEAKKNVKPETVQP